MAIELSCAACGSRLRVEDQFAGKQARCPSCNAVMPIPDAAGSPLASPPATPSAAAPGLGAPAAVNPFDSANSSERWFMQGGDGTKYGPVTKAELDGWVRDRRVAPNFRLQQEGREDWVPAATVYPQLAAPAGVGVPFAPGATGGANANPYADVPQSYAAAGYPMGVGYQKPHRGGLILALGIIGLLCCCFLSIAAIIMGNSDMKEMDAGIMDPSGRTTTKAGVIVAWVSIGLTLIGVAFQVLVAILQNQ
ncbi:MAG: GYF domain-containing protein [Planctomycetota bacterium]